MLPHVSLAMTDRLSEVSLRLCVGLAGLTDLLRSVRSAPHVGSELGVVAWKTVKGSNATALRGG
jgi:hypothetical protein